MNMAELAKALNFCTVSITSIVEFKIELIACKTYCKKSLPFSFTYLPNFCDF